MTEVEVDTRQIKVGICDECQGWITVAAFPKCEYNADAIKEFRLIVKTGGKIEVMLLTDWNKGSLREKHCNGHKVAKTKKVTAKD